MLFAELLLVFALGIVEIWLAVPTGFAVGLDAFSLGIATGLGGIAGVSIVSFLGGSLRAWIIRKRGGKSAGNPDSLGNRIWRRYGIIGLGLLAPLITGAPLGAALGIASGVPARKVFLWLSAGVVVWTAILTTLGALGLAGIRGLR